MANDTPLMPLREVHDLWAWTAPAAQNEKHDYVCGLVAATADAVLAAMKHGRAGGWIFGQECFIRAVCAIRDLNAKGTVHTYGTDLAQRLPTNWRKLADAVESYARDVPRQMCWTGERPPDSIPRDIISPEYDKPIDSHALQGLFDYCLAKAKAAFPAESDIMEMQYKTLVFNFPLNTTQTLSRLEAGHGETQAAANLAAKNSAAAKRAAEQIVQTTAGLPAAIAEVKAAIAEVKAEAAGAKVAAEGARAAAEKAAKKPTTVINAQPGATVNVVKPSRTDAGGTHGKRALGWRTQEDMATDFSKSATKICGKWYGEVSVAVAKDWESRYPNEARRERKSGYHAGLRNEPNPTPETKKAYYEAAANWNDYWRKHNEAFNAWLKANPNGDHATFLKTWERPGKTVHRNDTDKTMSYGADTSLLDMLDSGDFDNET